jgi:hypothetical protein
MSVRVGMISALHRTLFSASAYDAATAAPPGSRVARLMSPFCHCSICSVSREDHTHREAETDRPDEGEQIVPVPRLVTPRAVHEFCERRRTRLLPEAALEPVVRVCPGAVRTAFLVSSGKEA